MERPDDAPPPPYSETDISSASTPAAFRPSPADQNADDASVTASSSHSNIIYTPPETPDAQDDGAAAGGTDASSLPASAQAYFAARPAAGRPPSAHIIHAIHYADGMTPADLPYPGWAADRQITEQNWHDFVNYLLPPHAEKANKYTADRKLRAEQGETPCKAGPDASRCGQSLEAALQTVHDWNESLFAPRGVTLRLDPVHGFPGVPRAWNQTPIDASRGLPHKSDCSGPTGRPSEAWNRGRGWGWPRGRGMPAGPFLGAIRCVQGEPAPHDHHGAKDGYRGHGRGRCQYAGGPYRSHSRSSASSDSSSSSPGSDSSVGSLPDWDELSDAQLPVVRSSVWSWVHSGQPVPKTEYKRVKAEIKAAEGMPWARQAGNTSQRKEIKQLLAQWKEVQKSQKTAKKAAKKAAKKEKVTRKWERKAERKASKRNRKDHRHCERVARRESRTTDLHAHSAFDPPPPGGPSPVQPGAFGPAPGPTGLWPSGPGAFGFGPGRRGGPGPFGFFEGGRRGWGRGSFGGPWPHPPGSAASEQAARDNAQQAREDAASRQAALQTANRARHDASATAAAAVSHAHAVRDAALQTANRARHDALATAAAAVSHAHAVRDAALGEALRQRPATAWAHATTNAAADRAHQAAWQPWGWGPGAATMMSVGPSSQMPCSPRDRDRTRPDKERPLGDSNPQTQSTQQEKREVSTAQAGEDDVNVPARARQDRATEIHELENRLLALRMEADEALARQLAEEEARGGRLS